MGKTFSANSISSFLKNEHRYVSVESIYNDIRWLEQDFVIYPCQRFDLQGKEVLKTQEKYYLSDVSFKYALFGYNHSMLDGVLENIIFLELKRRGYEVYIGKNKTKEIDFCCHPARGTHLCSGMCTTSGKFGHRGWKPDEIRDHYPKYAVTTDPMDMGVVNGIRIVTLMDFLLCKDF